jgi:hypothetical protein
MLDYHRCAGEDPIEQRLTDAQLFALGLFWAAGLARLSAHSPESRATDDESNELCPPERRGLEPFGITHFYTDDWDAYERHLGPKNHVIRKQNTKIERKHFTLRIRIKRLAHKITCFSRSTQMHDIVIGLFVNRYKLGISVLHP